MITLTTTTGSTWTGARKTTPFGNDAGGGWPLSCPADMPRRLALSVRGSPRAWQQNGGGFVDGAGTELEL